MPALAWRLLHVLALSTLAVTQPLLGILGDNPTFFTAHDARPSQIVWLALTVALLPAAVLAAVETLVHVLRPGLDRGVHLTITAVLVLLVAIQVLDILPGHWSVPTVAAVAVTAGVVALYAAHESVRSVVSLLAVTPVVFVGLFLFVAPTSRLVFPDDVDAVSLDDLLTGDTLGDPAASDEGDDQPTLREQLHQRFPPVYLLVLDELPVASLLDETGGIDPVRWPNFARLADTSHFFANATTVGSTTERAVPSILTGRYESAAAPVYSLYPENLFTLLGDIYDITESDPLVDLCPPSICNGAAPTAVVELLATDPDGPVPTTTAAGSAPTPTTTVDGGSSLRLLLDDALVVFGHLAAPEGLDLGLPEIGATWGDFRGDLGGIADDGSGDPPPTDPGTPAARPTTTARAVDLGPGEVPTEDLVDVDAEAVREENTEILDRLITDDSRVADFRAEIAAFSASDVPRLHYLHTLLPHVPWRLHAGGETYADLMLPGYFSWWDEDPTFARAGQQRHLLQLGFTDRLLGEYLDALERAGILDDATVIVVADHGVSFDFESHARLVDDANVGAVAAVPLFYKLPGQTEGEVHDRPVETTDIVATIAAQLGIEIPWAVDGVDLFGPLPDRNRLVHNTFSTWIPEPFPPVIAEVTAEMLAVFGNGTDGNLYALAGLRDRIGDSVADLVDAPADYCWVREHPVAIPDDDGDIGFVGGRLAIGAGDPVPFALTIGDTLTGTATSLDRADPHRVYALGDPRYWTGASVDDIGLHEIENGRLRPVPEC